MQGTRILVKNIAKHANPLENPPWDAGRIPKNFRKAIEKYLQTQEFERRSYSQVINRDCIVNRYNHAKRVAYLVQNPITDEPIEIDVGCPAFGHFTRWIVEDGNHRLAAAIYRNDRHIYANIQGQISHAEKLFRVKIKE